ncbi:MAG: hypothetical protein ACREBC_24410 [Pyrinomonadaceae bacterium]
MDSELQALSEHMREFAIGLMGHALWHSVMTGIGNNPWSEQFGLLHVAHGGELLIKAAIAREHPLLIFSKTPALDKASSQKLTFEHLVRSGRTLGYNELPDTLWAVTGFALPDLVTYRRIGELRNAVQHLAVPNANYASLVLSYLSYVADPILREFWSMEVFRVIYENWGEDDYYLFQEEPWLKDALETNGIQYDGWIPTPETTRQD